MNPDEIPPGTHVEPNPDNPWPVAAATKADTTVEAFFLDRDTEHRVPRINLLNGTAVDPPLAPVAVAPSAPKPATDEQKPRNMAPWWIGVSVVIVVLAGGTIFLLLNKRPAPAPVTTPSPSPSPSASQAPSPTPTSTTSPTPSPSPSATPVPQTITAPTVAPTANNPQLVTITSKSGLWLRSSPTSINQSNVIGWMPEGAQISVDSTGSFWWHGTFRGKTGYFASKYTQ